MKRKDALIALSLSNLCYLPGWSELAYSKSASSDYYRYAPPGREQAFLLVLSVLLLAAVLYLLMRGARRTRNESILIFARLSAVFLLVLPLNFFRVELPPEFGTTHLIRWLRLNHMLIPAALGGLLCLALCVFFHRRLARVVAVCLMILSPLFILNVSRLPLFFGSSARGTSSKAGVTPGETRAAAAENPLYIFLFDELDYRLLFSERPHGVVLPAVDRLRNQAISAENAYPPAEHTLVSIPGLLTGTRYSKARPTSERDLQLTTLTTNEQLVFSERPNVFSAARAQGFHVTVVGWYHPYCRLLEAYVDRCFWQPYFSVQTGQVAHGEDRGLVWKLGEHLQMIFPWNTRRLAIFGYERVLEEAERALGKPTDLMYAHFPVPHPPAIYDRKRARLTPFKFSPAQDYIDSLVLADNTLGKMIAGLEQEGLWARSFVLVTSDHHWRLSKGLDGKLDKRVPFLLKMPGQSARYRIEGEFNTAALAELSLELLTQRLRTAEQVEGWLLARDGEDGHLGTNELGAAPPELESATGTGEVPHGAALP